MRVEFYFDPVCPWCWETAKWIIEVRELRPIELDWLPFSLALKNRGSEQDEGWAAVQDDGRRALRVIEWARAEYGPVAVQPLYLHLAGRRHEDRQRSFDFVSAFQEVGLAPAPPEIAEDDDWDDVIEHSMSRALEVVGDDVGVPILVFPDGVGLYGPIIGPAPTGEAAARLFDTTVQLAHSPEFFELKRSRRPGALRR